MHAPDNRGSISDYLWCDLCDEQFAQDRKSKGETCIHCLFLITKSWRASRKATVPMFEEGQLTMDYDLDGERCSFSSGVRDGVAGRAQSGPQRPAEGPPAIEDSRDRLEARSGSRYVPGPEDLATEQKAALILIDNQGNQAYPPRRPGVSRDLGRTSGDLTEAEKRELGKPCPYKYPVRLICGPMRALTREARESLGIRRAKHAVELVPPNPEDRVVKMRKFFDAFWNDHCESGLYDA